MMQGELGPPRGLGTLVGAHRTQVIGRCMAISDLSKNMLVLDSLWTPIQIRVPRVFERPNQTVPAGDVGAKAPTASLGAQVIALAGRRPRPTQSPAVAAMRSSTASINPRCWTRPKTIT